LTNLLIFLNYISSDRYDLNHSLIGVAFLDFYELFIPGLRLWVSLGCGVEEKTNLQPVDIDIKIDFPQEPIGCHSDQLGDVVCYKTLTELVIESVKNRSFDLIEFLAAHIFEAITKQLRLEGSVVEIVVTKPNHPVPHVQKGIVFKYCRRLSQKSL
jgi:FolB domain-containing protein